MGIFDDLADVAEDVVDAAGDAAGDLLEAGGDLFEGGTQLVGIAVAAGAYFVLGPGAVIPAFIGGSVAADALIRHRPITDAERAFADQVFSGTLPPNDEIIVTNLVGIDDRPFVCPNVSGQLLVNLGDAGYEAPMTHRGGKVFIHELTHVWQFKHTSFVPGLVCEAIGLQLSDPTYDPGDGGRPWPEYNLEQQATIADEWFAPSRGVFPAEAPAHPFWRYICENIRGRALPRHEAYGHHFMLPHDLPPGADSQNGWRYCGRCRAMFYDGDPADKGTCPTGGGHQAHGFDFVLSHWPAPDGAVQDGWRYCGKCRTMFYDADPADKGVCAAV